MLKSSGAGRNAQKREILIFGYYGYKNIGDDIMLNVLVSHLADHFPEAHFGIISRNPVKIIDPRKLDISFIKLRPLDVLWGLFQYKIVILGGGTVIFDFNKNLRYLRPLLKILSFLLLTKILRKKNILAGIGIGSLGAWWSKYFAERILNLADFITVRDRLSFEYVRGLGFGPDRVSRSFDMAILLERSRKIHNESRHSKRLGIAIFPFYEIYFKNKERDVLLVEQIMSFLRIHLEKFDNQFDEIAVFVLKSKSTEDDDWLSKCLADRTKILRKTRIVSYGGDPNSILSEIKGCSFFISMRFHAALLAYLCGIPQLMIAYHQKCIILGEEIGVHKDLIFSPDDILAGALLKNPHINLKMDDNYYSHPLEQAKSQARLALDKVAAFIKSEE